MTHPLTAAARALTAWATRRRAREPQEATHAQECTATLTKLRGNR